MMHVIEFKVQVVQSFKSYFYASVTRLERYIDCIIIIIYIYSKQLTMPKSSWLALSYYYKRKL